MTSNDPAAGRGKDPLLGAALVRLSLERRGASLDSEFYLGILEDLDLYDEDVEAYVEQHRDELIAMLDRGSHH